MKFLVIGGAGYVGSHFVAMASELGHTCFVLDNLSTGHEKAIIGRAEFIKGDVRRSVGLADQIDRVDPDCILHYAASSLVGESVRNPAMYYDNNLLGMKTLLEVLSRRQVKPGLIFSSSCAVYGQPKLLPIREDNEKLPMSPYGRSKLMCEYMIEDFCTAYGLKATALRYFNAAGAAADQGIGESHHPETHIIPNILKAIASSSEFKLFGSDYPTSDGTCIRDYVHVSDLAESHLIAAQKLMHVQPGSFAAINIGTGKGYSNREIIAEAEKVTGKKLAILQEGRRPGDPPELVADPAHCKKELGFLPTRSSLTQIIESAWAWHRDQKF